MPFITLTEKQEKLLNNPPAEIEKNDFLEYLNIINEKLYCKKAVYVTRHTKMLTALDNLLPEKKWNYFKSSAKKIASPLLLNYLLNNTTYTKGLIEYLGTLNEKKKRAAVIALAKSLRQQVSKYIELIKCFAALLEKHLPEMSHLEIIKNYGQPKRPKVERNYKKRKFKPNKGVSICDNTSQPPAKKQILEPSTLPTSYRVTFFTPESCSPKLPSIEEILYDPNLDNTNTWYVLPPILSPTNSPK